MEIKDLESIFDKILNKSAKLIENEKHESKKREDIIPNERVYHHMFSSEVSSYFSSKGIDVWEHLLLIPEYETDPEYAKHKNSNAKRVNEKAGQFDFAISKSVKPQIFIEFKGPNLYRDNDIEDVMLKLLLQNKSDLKVFAAIITSSKKGDSKHKNAIENHFINGLKRSLDKLKIENLKDRNLYAYVARVEQ